MGLSLIAATTIGAVFALINYQLAMSKGGASASAGDDFDDEEDI
jgi:PTS system mannose-specific IIC component